MCLRNLFNGNDCTWILFIIILILLVDDECCDKNLNTSNCGGGCGCGCC